MKSNSRVYVIGHKNPDTDSICSAIAYADIKNRTDKYQLYSFKISLFTYYILTKIPQQTCILIISLK